MLDLMYNINFYKRLMLSFILGRLGGATAAAQRRPESPVLSQNIWRNKHSDSNWILLNSVITF